MKQLPPSPLPERQEPHVIRADRRRLLGVQELNGLPLFDYSRVRTIADCIQVKSRNILSIVNMKRKESRIRSGQMALACSLPRNSIYS